MKFRFQLIRSALMLCAFISSGCSLRVVAIRHGEWLAAKKIDSAFDLSHEHYKDLRVATKSIDQKVRQELLPKIAATLVESSQRLTDGLEEKDSLWLKDQVEKHRQSIADTVAPAIAPLTTQLSTHEIKHFSEYLKDENRETEDLAKLPAAEFHNKQLKNLRKVLKFWITTASDERLDQLATPFLVDQTAFEQRLDRRHKSQAAFILWLTKQQGENPAITAKEIQRWAKEPYWFMEQAKELGMNEWLVRFIPKLVAFERLLTPSEKQALQKNLHSLADDLTEASKT